MLFIAPIIEGRRGPGGLGDLELPVDTKPVAVIGVLPRVTLKKPKIDEVGGHVSTIVEELKTRKVICQDVKVVAVAIAHDATAKTQAGNERHGEFQKDVLRLHVHPTSPHPTP